MMVAINITPLVNAVIALCASVITVFLIPWLRAKAGAERASQIMAFARIGVSAAEQIYGAGCGTEKRSEVIKFMERHGFTFDSDAVHEAIEAAVFEMNAMSLAPLEIDDDDE